MPVIAYTPTYCHVPEEDGVLQLRLGCRSDWGEVLVCSLLKWHLYLFEMLGLFHTLMSDLAGC